MKNIYVADFETTTTTTSTEYTRVWATCVCEMSTNEITHLSTSIDEFMQYIEKLPSGSVVYFHNLAFDGKFILYYLTQNNFTYSENRESKRTYRTLITDLGQFYEISICFKKRGKKAHHIEIRDSLKKIALPVADMAKAFGLEMSKGEIDYDLVRPVGHILTQEEIDYIERDVKIVAQCLKVLYDEGMAKMTSSGDALWDFKRRLANSETPKEMNKIFEYHYPKLNYEIDGEIRKSYKGGFTYVNPKFQNKIIESGTVFDVNSLYPSIMRYKSLPIGRPRHYRGMYQEDTDYPLFIQCVFVCFRLKPNHIPTIQVKSNALYQQTEYLTESDKDTPVMLWLTSVDFQLFIDHYYIDYIEYVEGYKFREATGIFNTYIDHWVQVKNESAKSGNSGMRALSKLMLNSLYGKFGTNPVRTPKIPYYDEELGLVRYNLGETTYDDPIYTALASFVTSYGRDITIRTAQSVYDRFIYADTDSIHLVGYETPDIDIDDYRLGAWKHEYYFVRGKFLRPKTYAEEAVNKHGEVELEIRCAGLPSNCKTQIKTLEGFNHGTVVKGKKVPKTVRGGVLLVEVDFEIK